MASWHHEGRRQAATPALTAWTRWAQSQSADAGWWAGSHSEGCGMTGGQEMGMPRAGDVSDLPEGGGGRILSPYRGHGTWTSMMGTGETALALALAVALRCSASPALVCVAAGEARTRGQTNRCRGRWATVWGFASMPACLPSHAFWGSVGLGHVPSSSTPGAVRFPSPEFQLVVRVASPGPHHPVTGPPQPAPLVQPLPGAGARARLYEEVNSCCPPFSLLMPSRACYSVLSPRLFSVAGRFRSTSSYCTWCWTCEEGRVRLLISFSNGKPTWAVSGICLGVSLANSVLWLLARFLSAALAWPQIQLPWCPVCFCSLLFACACACYLGR